MLRYAITDSKVFGASFEARREGLISQAKRLAVDGVDYIQLREKDLEAGEMLGLAVALRGALMGGTRLLVNSRVDVAVAAVADGVHLTSHPDELTPAQVREISAKAGAGGEPVVSVSCHSHRDVERAVANGASLILFGPVFEKRVHGEVVIEGTGLDMLKAACEIAGGVAVLALGGVTLANAMDCLAAGAVGIAGIRLFK